MKSYRYKLEGLDCAACAKKVEEKLASTSGFEDVNVNFSTLKLSFKTEKYENDKNLTKMVEEIVKKVEPDVNVIENSNKEINEKCESIIGFDHVIYDSKVKIDKFNKQLQGIKCSCGAILTPEDRFCGKCGQKVEIPVDNTEYIECKRCLSNIDKTSTYCPCCGIKL